jgi:ubiquinone/menaquinone biosynthesis C-methylase UbiE
MDTQATYYDRADLGTAIDDALRRAGKDPASLTVDDLAPVDHFHVRGKEATLDLAARAELEPGMRVLDVGGGIGGAARVLAHERGCQVTVLDLTEVYCRVGADLTRRTGLGDRVSFRHGTALAMPFADASFDRVWTQHSSMNIADKATLYSEARRVLRPGGRLAIHEIMAGPKAPPEFPVPWAREPSVSFLETPEAVRTLLERAGFRVLTWDDQSTITVAWFKARLAAAGPGGPPPLGLHLLLGADMPLLFRNMIQGFEQDRVVAVMAVLEKPAA